MLAKKYFLRWKSRAWRRALNRHAKNRRSIIAATMKQEREKRIRGEAELEAILEAQKERERIQAEHLQAAVDDTNSIVPAPVIRHSSTSLQTAGRKRKSLYAERSQTTTDKDGRRTIIHGHKRSKTLENSPNSEKPSKSTNALNLQSSPALRTSASAFTDHSILRNADRSQGLENSLSRRKLDTTRTDYFRLKAAGIDPDTPIIPETISSLRRKEQAHARLDLNQTQRRARTPSVLGSSQSQLVPEASDTSNTMITQKSLNAARSPNDFTCSIPNARDNTDSDDDADLFRQLREVRTQLSEQSDWFRAQSVEIEKDIQEQELRRIASQPSLIDRSQTANPSLGRVNGYDYRPGHSRVRSLSRTEERIRTTGAHGLATKPFGASSDYLAVAMSKTTALKQSPDGQAGDIGTAFSHRKKGKRKKYENDNVYRYAESDVEDESEEKTDTVLKSRRKARLLQQRPHHRFSHPHQDRTFRSVEPKGVPDEADEGQAQEPEEEEEQSPESVPEKVLHHKSECDGDQETSESDPGDYADEENNDTDSPVVEEEADEYEDGEEETGEDGPEQTDEGGEEETDDVPEMPNTYPQIRGGYWLRSSVEPEPVAQTSRATTASGPGASADDAFVLDSD